MRIVRIFILLLILLPCAARCEVITGQLDGGISYSIDAETGTLSITAESDYALMPDYSITTYKTAPWAEYAANITRLELDAYNTGRYAFHSLYRLESVTFSGRVTEISDDAFLDCEKLTALTFSEGLRSIGMMAFYNCRSLSVLCFPDSLEKIGNYAFNECPVSAVTFGRQLKTIGDLAFEGGTFTKLVLPPALRTVQCLAFGSCAKLTEVTFMADDTCVEVNAFSGCGALRDVYYPGRSAGRDRWLSGGAFAAEGNEKLISARWHYADEWLTGFTALTLPEGLLILEAEALSGTGAQMIIIPPDCTFIAEDAFKACSELMYIVNNSAVTITRETHALPPTTAGIISD